MKNHDLFLTKLRWQTATKEFSQMKKFSTDCFQYIFKDSLTEEQQNNFMNFIGDSDNLNHLTPVDFCNYFIQNNIPFDLEYKYIKEIGIARNYQSYKVIRYLQKKLRKIKKNRKDK